MIRTTNKPEKIYNKTGPKCPALTESYQKKVYRLALLGATQQQIADFFEVPKVTLEYWLKKYPDFYQAWKNGQLEADGKVAMALYQRALGYKHKDVVVLTNRVTEYDDNGKPIRSYNEPLLVPVTKCYPPDGYACDKWLKARHRELWGDPASNVNLNIQANINHTIIQDTDFTDLTNEELKLAIKLGLNKAIQQPALGSN
jgi:hypothetical protein